MALLIVASPILAKESGGGFDDLDSPLTFPGFVRQLFDVQKAPSLLGPAKTTSSSASRARAAAVYKEEQSGFEAHGSANFDLIYSSDIDAWNADIRNRFLPTGWSQEHGRFLLKEDVHRLFIASRGTKWHFVLGRQAISWGQGRLINPLDLITPRGPFLADEEDVPGADAMSVSYFPNARESFQIVCVPYHRNDSSMRAVNSRDANLLLRRQFSRGSLEATLLGGRHFHSWAAGGEIVLTKWDASFRAAYLGRREEKPHNPLSSRVLESLPAAAHQFVFGASYAFWKGTLRANAEIFFNSAASGDNPTGPLFAALEGMAAAGGAPPALPNDDIFFRTNGRVTSKNPVLVQLSLGGNFTELTSGNAVAIVDPQGKSAFVGPQVSVSLDDETVWAVDVRIVLPGGSDAEFSGNSRELLTYVRRHF